MNKLLKLMTGDKAFHFLYCFLFASIWIPLGIGFAVGKEIFDWLKYGNKVGKKAFAKMAIADLAADVLGILAAIFVITYL